MPIEQPGDDQFQFSQVSQLLFDALHQPKPPAYIALLGPWGSGKSSVLLMLKKLLERSHFSIEFINVWKFADDEPSLHRKIVREVERQLKVNPASWDQELTKMDSTQVKGFYALLLDMFRKPLDHKMAWLNLLAVVMTLVAATFAARTKTPYPLYLTVVLWFLLTQSNVQRTSQSTIKTLPSSYRDQFEEHFKIAVRKYLGKKEGKRLVLVFDDLDRLPSEQLKAALNTIRTFLHSERCVFIVPCDEEILRRALAEGNDDPTVTTVASELVNKTFDVMVRLPVLEQSNMKQYARKLLNNQPVAWSKNPLINVDRVLFVLIHSGVKTPRQVKTILNTFAADWDLAVQRDKQGGAPSLTREPLTVALFSVIKASFSDSYQQLSANPKPVMQYWRDEEQAKSLPEGLKAFLSRVQDFIPDDPGPFLYFNNGELNALTGRPAVVRVRDFLIDAQENEFVRTFDQLDDEDREMVLTATLDEVTDSSGLAIRNVLSVLVKHPEAMSYISEMSRAQYDLVIRQEAELFANQDLSLVTTMLESMDASESTWKVVGQAISKDEVFTTNKENLLQLWTENEVAVSRFSISNLGDRLASAFTTANNGTELCDALFKIDSTHAMADLDWYGLLLTVARNTDEAKFPFLYRDWFEKWSEVMGRATTISMIHDVVAASASDQGDVLEDIGSLWCKQFDSDQANELTKLVDLIARDDFTGFSNEDLSYVGECILNHPSEELGNAVSKCLSQLWEHSRTRLTELLTLWSRLPSSCDFVASVLNEGSLTAEERDTLLKVIKDSADKYNVKSQILDVFTNDMIQARTQNRVVNVAGWLLPILLLPSYRDASQDYLEKWFLDIPPGNWLNWSEQSVAFSVSVYTSVMPTETVHREWLLQLIHNLTLAGRGVQYANLQVQGKRYLQLVMDAVNAHPQLLNWAKATETWSEDDMFSVLASNAKIDTIAKIHSECQLDAEPANDIVLRFSDLAADQQVESCAKRFAEATQAQRASFIERLNVAEVAVQQNVVTRLANSKSISLAQVDEMHDWELDTKFKQILCSSAAEHTRISELTQWVDAQLERVLEENPTWVRRTIQWIWRNRRDYTRILSDDTIQRFLDTGDERARMMMEYMIRRNMSKSQLKTHRDQLKCLSATYPDEAKKLEIQGNFRFFSKKKSG